MQCIFYNLIIFIIIDEAHQEELEETKVEDLENKDTKAEDTSVWNQKRTKIMRDFEKEFGDMEVFLNEGGDRDIDRPIKMGKGKSRLDQIIKNKESKPGGSKIASINADEFQNQFKKLKKKMMQFWGKEDKVACLKICIQCAKLLNDTSTPEFYPQKFMIITEILDEFGTMVFDRMKKLSLLDQGVINWQGVIDNEIDFRNTPDFVKQKTNNWFLKCA